MSTSGSSRFVQLDALRGIAALMVVYFHAIEVCVGRVQYSREYVVWDMLDWGRVGVVSFFCISGFVIPYSFGASAHPARAFVISRVARLYPAYWCSIVLALVASHFAGRPMEPLATILANLTMLQTALGEPDLNGVYWTLFIEWMFYAISLAAFLAGWLRSSVFLFAASLTLLATAAAAAGGLRPSAMVPLAALSLMMLACLWRRLIVDRDGLAIWLTPVGAAVWLLVFPFLTQRVFPEDWRRMSSSWLAGISIFVVFTVMKSQVPRMLVWLGALSYGIYLYHPTVSHVVFRFLPSLIHAPHAAFLLTALGAIGLASISYTLIERPCIRFGKSRSNRTPDVRTSLQPTSVGSVS